MEIDKKINRVIASCKTEEQFLNAVQYLLLAEKSNVISPVRTLYWIGVMNGIAHVKRWEA